VLADCDPTFRLLLATLCWPQSGHRPLAGEAMANVEWGRFVMLANRHRVAPLVSRSLLSANAEIPGALARDFATALKSALFAEMRIADQLAGLQQLLRSNGIDPILLKGPGLSLRAFGVLGLRTYRDLDLLIADDAAASACALLISAGYEPLEPREAIVRGDFSAWRKDHKDALFRQSETGLLVELHWRLFDNRALMPERELPRPVALGMPPLETSFVLPLEAELPYLSLHGALHGWSRLRWLADINALIGNAPEDLLLTGAAASPAVAQALILARELLGARLSPRLCNLLDRSVRARWLAKLAWSEILRSGTQELEAVRFGSTVKNLSHYALMDSSDKLFEELRFDFAAQPRLAAGPQRKGRLADWMSRHLLNR
jgi:hypothetical protein